jgi:membrane protease YdiL (CAAX protease family)
MDQKPPLGHLDIGHPFQCAAYPVLWFYTSYASGCIFGYLLVWSGSMWLPIIAHFFNNAFAVIAMYLIDRGIINPELEEIGAGAESYYAAFLSLGVVILLILLIRKDNKGKTGSLYQ